VTVARGVFHRHNPASVDKWVAEKKQAKWLEKVLAEEHERDRKHPDRIELPEPLRQMFSEVDHIKGATGHDRYERLMIMH
jgi:hypothetical protein